MHKPTAVALAAAVLLPLAIAPATPAAALPASAPMSFPASTAKSPEPGFRVLPYLQAPGSTSMTINWISETDHPGTLSVQGPGLGNQPGKGNSSVQRSEPEYLDLMEYTQAELEQHIPGLEQGSWLKSNSNYKHSVTLEGLKPGKKYNYTVTQSGQTHTAAFETAPDGKSWKNIRIVAFSDSETEPRGRTEHREWELSPVNGYTSESLQRPGDGSQWAETFGMTTRYGQPTLRYPLDQSTAFNENLKHVQAANPDLVMMAGDLTQGSGYQPAWDEFFGHVAGEHSDLASNVPLLPALGNWETYAALNGGYGSDADRTPAVISRNRFLDYFSLPQDPEHPEHKGSYYRVDHGPVTVLTLDSTNGRPDENTDTGTLSGEKFSGDDTNLTAENQSTDTQGQFTFESYVQGFKDLFPGSTEQEVDLPNMDAQSAQWDWTEKQLAEARADGQIVLVQFHHSAYSNGVHGTPPNHEHPDNQSGTAMRAYSPMFEDHGVAAVISGHDEMFERSWVDADGDGRGFHSYDVGVAADGLRGEKLVQNAQGEYEPLRFNSHSQWSAPADQPETWKEDENGVAQLVSGGLHYGHLQIDIAKKAKGAELTLTPVYVFPKLDSEYQLEHTERRVYDDVVTFPVGQDGAPLAK
ncbi:phosphoesterase [Arthrobacter sp. MYb224]|uniref:metallophosphoesterase n=1 Tax=Micrococcaceae TaxID=1268 RepID=UPI000CFB65AC|nr:metallophosphoesterase [Arthrobacter sp. MYb224]PRA00289.1 phosphoesterase [Arthrobacter sp. MYb224]